MEILDKKESQSYSKAAVNNENHHPCYWHSQADLPNIRQLVTFQWKQYVLFTWIMPGPKSAHLNILIINTRASEGSVCISVSSCCI